MNDWTDPPGDHRTGRDPRRVPPPSLLAPPPSTRTAPLPGMPSPAVPGRYDSSGHERGRRGGGSRNPRRRAGKGRRFVRTAAVLSSVLLLAGAGTYVWADTRLNQQVDLGTLSGRVPRGEGTNYLVVGSDSREGLSPRDREELNTGSTEGRRTDSVILLHTGANGTTMLSLPRDSWVTLPPYVDPDTGRSYRAAPNKLNAAFSLGGPDLLVRTVERNTGVHIDHYAEIGFAGFVGVVDAVGGVDLCLDKPVRDKDSGADLPAGCQTLDGAEALAFVRQRKQEAQGDLGRTRNQQKFLAALARKAVTPSTLADPSKTFPTLRAGLDTLIVDESTELPDLMSLFEAMRKAASGGGRQLNVPVADPDLRTPQGSAVKWDDRRARALFAALREDRPPG
ncbi:LCP family protein [Streptomyces coeruleorubidus]|uniref:LytR family transcriptional regulator n=1 Tax=Streptomyces coeruleorubidus TaxID=116188 RepID=A0A5J6IGW9_STRC4|nr:LCP family protein [Streptomyces coeruleorubidus]QEV30504.1 LytR family transcriptional regulator [Streptomyces coeruleorubidus]GGT95128.1 transcriptional regulator [Streptomyces coeruleorubidus]